MKKKKPKPLTNKQTLFVDHYLQTFNASEAARLAGYPARSAHAVGWENLRKPEIKAQIESRLDEVHMGAFEVLKRLADIARGDLGEFLAIGPNGYSIDMAAAEKAGKTQLIKRLKQKTTTINREQETQEITTEELELHNALTALELLGKHLMIFKELGTKDNPLYILGLNQNLDKVYGADT